MRPTDSGLDCAAGKRRHKRSREGVHLIPAGGGRSLRSRETPPLSFICSRCFIRTPLTAAGPFVQLILAIKHACSELLGVFAWGVYYCERRVFMEKSNSRPPSATFYHTEIRRTKRLRRFVCSRDT